MSSLANRTLRLAAAAVCSLSLFALGGCGSREVEIEEPELSAQDQQMLELQQQMFQRQVQQTQQINQQFQQQQQMR